MANTNIPSKETLALVAARIEGAAGDLYSVMQLAHAAIEDPDNAPAMLVGIEAIVARSGRIFDLCARQLGHTGTGFFSDFQFMEALRDPEVAHG